MVSNNIKWKKERLGTVLILLKDGTHNPPKRTENGIPMLSAVNINNGRINFNGELSFISQNDYEEMHKKYEISKDDVLMTVVGTLGRVAIVKQQTNKFTVQRSVAILRTDKTELLPKYLYYYVQGNDFQISLSIRSNTTAQSGVYLKELSKIEIELPPINEQEVIVKIFTSVDDAIEKTETIIKQIEKVKKGLMQQLLTKGIKRTKFKETEIGEIPEEWEVMEFKQIMILQRGFDLPVQKRQEGINPLLSANGITDHIDQYKVEGPGVVTGRSGTIGKVHYIDKNFWPLNTSLYVKEMYDNDPKFLYYFLLNFKLERFATGTGVPTLNRNVVHKEKVAIPPINEQKKISKILTNIDEKINIENDKLFKLQMIKRGLMQVLLTGKIRVKVDEEEVTTS